MRSFHGEAKKQTARPHTIEKVNWIGIYSVVNLKHLQKLWIHGVNQTSCWHNNNISPQFHHRASCSKGDQNTQISITCYFYIALDFALVIIALIHSEAAVRVVVTTQSAAISAYPSRSDGKSTSNTWRLPECGWTFKDRFIDITYCVVEQTTDMRDKNAHCYKFSCTSSHVQNSRSHKVNQFIPSQRLRAITEKNPSGFQIACTNHQWIDKSRKHYRVEEISYYLIMFSNGSSNDSSWSGCKGKLTEELDIVHKVTKEISCTICADNFPTCAKPRSYHGVGFELGVGYNQFISFINKLKK